MCGVVPTSKDCGSAKQFMTFSACVCVLVYFGECCAGC
jgi:hypothetical protein